jgi:hypothetical protein
VTLGVGYEPGPNEPGVGDPVTVEHFHLDLTPNLSFIE